MTMMVTRTHSMARWAAFSRASTAMMSSQQLCTTAVVRNKQLSSKLLLVRGCGAGGATSSIFSWKLGQGKVALLEPSKMHRYQPLWTLVGRGEASFQDTGRPVGSVLHKDADWIKDRAVNFVPADNMVTTSQRKEDAPSSTMSGEKKLVVIDTDPGVDDAQGILMALADPDVEVVAITVTHGNVGVEQAARNALRVLAVADRLDIPVYMGAARSILGEKLSASFFHGADGLGDVRDPLAPDLDAIKKEHAVTALVRLANQYKERIHLICIGPLTNVAMALRQDPEFGRNLKDCFIMGGSYEATGNTTSSACAEFNFLADPEAAYIVLNDLAWPITMVCWELCLKYGFSWAWYDKYTNNPTRKGRFVKDIGQQSLEIYYRRGTEAELPKYETADSMLVAVALKRSVSRGTRAVYCTVELHGQFSRGQMIVDWQGCLKKNPNVNIVTAIDQDKYGSMLMEAVK